MITCRVFLFHEHPPKSYTYLKSYQVEAPGEEPVKHLGQTALAHIKSHSSFRRLKSFEMAEPKIYSVKWLCGAQIARNLMSGFEASKVLREESWKTICTFVDLGYLEPGTGRYFHTPSRGCYPEVITDGDPIVIVFSKLLRPPVSKSVE
jgi:hypothetical protein